MKNHEPAETIALWYRAYAKTIYQHCYSILHNPTEAEDATQDTFYKALKKFHQFRGDAHPLSWLKTIATHLCLDHLKAFPTRLFRHKKEVSPQMAQDNPQPVESLMLKEAYHAFQKGLAKLSPQQRVVLTLRFFEELPLEGIAKMMGVHVGTVKRHLFRALDRLKKMEVLNETLNFS